MVAALASVLISAPFPAIAQELLGAISGIGPILHSFLINVQTSAMGSAFLAALVDLVTYDPVPCED